MADLAAGNVHSEVVKLLLAKGAKIYDKNDMLRAASRGGILWLVKDMLAKGAGVNTGDFGDTPLHDAAMMGHADVVKLLLAHGAKPAGAYDLAKTDVIRKMLADAAPAIQIFGVSLLQANCAGFRKTIKQAGCIVRQP